MLKYTEAEEFHIHKLFIWLLKTIPKCWNSSVLIHTYIYIFAYYLTLICEIKKKHFHSFHSFPFHFLYLNYLLFLAFLYYFYYNMHYYLLEIVFYSMKIKLRDFEK